MKQHGNIFNTSATKLVSVYGSLLSGLGNHRVLGNSKFIGAGKTKELLTLVEYCGGFPSLDKSLATHQVVVETYEVTNSDTASHLDSLEGYPSFYNRSIVDIELDNGTVVQSWIYDINNSSESLPIVDSGDWRSHASTQLRHW
jgi:gamma-glutamylaminecyclotransferase